MSRLSNIWPAVFLLTSLIACFYLSSPKHGDILRVREVKFEGREPDGRVRWSQTEPILQQKPHTSRGNRCVLSMESRFDCARDKVLSQRQCEERGCCYAPLPGTSGPPWCFYPRGFPGYKMSPFRPTKWGQTATLTRASPSYLPKDIPTLRLEVREETPACLHLTLKDQSSPRYEVQLPDAGQKPPKVPQQTLYSAEYESEPFGFIVQRRANGRVLLNTTVAPLLFADQYLQFSTTLASSLVSGLGER